MKKARFVFIYSYPKELEGIKFDSSQEAMIRFGQNYFGDAIRRCYGDKVEFVDGRIVDGDQGDPIEDKK